MNKMTQQNLYETILDALKQMRHVKIKDSGLFLSPFRCVHTVGEILIGYEYKKKPYFFGLISSYSPLATLTDIKNYLSNIPGIYEPAEFDLANRKLAYTRETEMSEKDKVVVTEYPILLSIRSNRN